MDDWLRGLFEEACRGLDGAALVAVGSYGRQELCPHSDLDLVLLHDGRQPVAAAAERLWYPIWDSKVRLDHSVRTVADTLAAAGGDLKVALGLLDARLVAGDTELFRRLTDRGRRFWEDRAGSLLGRLHQAVVERHERHGEVAFLLEPELKEGRGGLRDVVAVRAAVVAKPGLGPVPAEVSHGHRFLLTVRAALHDRAGRTLDRLVLQEQDAVAEALDLHDADELMAMLAGSARAIARYGDWLWRRAALLPAARDPRRRRPPVTLRPGVVLHDGEVRFTDDFAIGKGGVAERLADAVRLAGAAAEVNAPIAPDVIDALASSTLDLAGAPWPDGVRDSFVSLLGWGVQAIPQFEALDRAGVVPALLPEWRRVRNRPQRNAYHRYTVDRHLLEAAAEAATLARDVSRPDLLLIAAFLHDVGKGAPGDHSTVGADLAAEVVRRMGLSRRDAEIVVTLVRHHLLLADCATRRDPYDPATVATVVDAVGDVDTLELLAALTEADSKATGPMAWNGWKQSLVVALVDQVRLALAGDRAPAPDFPTPADRSLAVAGTTVVRIGPTTTVVAPDEVGLLGRVATVLAALGLQIRSARAATWAGMAIEEFEVAPELGDWPDESAVRGRIEAAIAGSADADDLLARRRRTYHNNGGRQAASVSPPRVLFDRSALPRTEVIEVRCVDRPGILADLAAALSRLGLDVVQARAATLGHEVVDAFYVRPTDGGVLDDDRRSAVTEALLTALATSDRSHAAVRAVRS